MIDTFPLVSDAQLINAYEGAVLREIPDADPRAARDATEHASRLRAVASFVIAAYVHDRNDSTQVVQAIDRLALAMKDNCCLNRPV